MNAFTFPFDDELQLAISKARVRYRQCLEQGEITSIDELVGICFGAETSTKMTQFLLEWYQNIVELKFLKDLFEDSKISEIIIHQSGHLQIDFGGILQDLRLNNFSDEDLELTLKTQTLKHGISWNYADPLKSFYGQIQQFSVRFSLVHSSVGPNSNSKIFIRKINQTVFSLSSFSLSEKQQHQIKQMIIGKKNVLISGATNSGKSSLMKCLLNEVPKSEHMVIIEDTHEMNLRNLATTHMTADFSNFKRELEQFCSFSLRLRPDRIVIGEVRSKEVVPFLLALTSGHRGMMATLHANSADQVIDRLSFLFSVFSKAQEIGYQQIKNMISDYIDCVIHMDKRKVVEIKTY